MLGPGSIAHWLVIARPGPAQYTDRQQPQPMDSQRDPGSSTQGGNMNIRETAPRFTELEKFSTRPAPRDFPAKAAPTKAKLKVWRVVDADPPANEPAFWSEVP